MTAIAHQVENAAVWLGQSIDRILEPRQAGEAAVILGIIPVRQVEFDVGPRNSSGVVPLLTFELVREPTAGDHPHISRKGEAVRVVGGRLAEERKERVASGRSRVVGMQAREAAT